MIIILFLTQPMKYKISVLGGPGVGKSTIIHNLVYKHAGTIPPTLGTEQHLLILRADQLSFFDASGQIKY